MGQHLVLLRGINVGGKNVIPMADLRTCFERHGFRDVRTYIQSGNVLFSGARSSRAALTARIEAMLSGDFGYRASVVLRSHRQLREVVRRAPDGFGAEPERYRYDVLFLKDGLRASDVLAQVPTREGVDRAYAGAGALYFSRLISQASKSRLSKLTGMAVYQRMTIRNWNTTTKLLAMMEDR